MSSDAICIATNSLEKVDVSTVFCLLEYQTIGALLMKMITPVCDLHVTLQPACGVSMKQLTVMGLPLALGMFLELVFFEAWIGVIKNHP